MMLVGGAQITENLRNVLGCKRLAGLQLDDQLIFHQKIGEIVTQHCAIFIAHLKGFLLFAFDASHTQPMRQTSFIDLFQMPMPQVSMQRKACLTHPITQLEYSCLVFPMRSLCPLWPTS